MVAVEHDAAPRHDRLKTYPTPCPFSSYNINGAGKPAYYESTKERATLVSSLIDFIGSPLTTLSASANGWRMANWATLVPKIAALEPELLKL